MELCATATLSFMVEYQVSICLPQDDGTHDVDVGRLLHVDVLPEKRFDEARECVVSPL